MKAIRLIRNVARSLCRLDPKPEKDSRIGMTPEEYRKCFAESERGDDLHCQEKSFGKTKIEKALEQAYDQRKFEIELYWKRATYFWTFIGAAFVGYAAFLTGSTPHLTGALIMSQVGLVFTVAWYLVNRGSKFWQENWENHVCLLEDDVTGPVYKMCASRDPHEFASRSRWDRRWIAPRPFSVSKINTIISMYMVFIWLLLGAAAIGMWVARLFGFNVNGQGFQLLSHLPVFVGVIWSSCFALRILWRQSSTHQGDHRPRVTERRVLADPGRSRHRMAPNSGVREA